MRAFASEHDDVLMCTEEPGFDATVDDPAIHAPIDTATARAEPSFTLGDQPEARYVVAREALEGLGHATTLSYLREMAEAVLEECVAHYVAALVSFLRGVSEAR